MKQNVVELLASSLRSRVLRVFSGSVRAFWHKVTGSVFTRVNRGEGEAQLHPPCFFTMWRAGFKDTRGSCSTNGVRASPQLVYRETLERRFGENAQQDELQSALLAGLVADVHGAYDALSVEVHQVIDFSRSPPSFCVLLSRRLTSTRRPSLAALSSPLLPFGLRDLDLTRSCRSVAGRTRAAARFVSRWT